jgi:hypothetical protein
MNRYARMLMAAGTLTTIALVWNAGAADPEPKKAPNFRTSPKGYSDTPMLPGQKWRVHDIDRPRPAVVTPGAKPGDPPSDAIVLFDGKDLSKWEIPSPRPDQKKKVDPNRPTSWKVGKGYFEVAPGAGTMRTKEKFGDMQLHIEWASTPMIYGDSQWRGNSGILIMERYEIQVLDSHNNPTYADGQAGSIYGQWPPLVNAVRKPGEWNAYDIVFEAPKFDGGKLVQPAFQTVFLNGVLLHNRKEVIGEMAHRVVGAYKGHAAEESLALQDHDVPVQYRNVWVRRLKGYDQP